MNDDWFEDYVEEDDDLQIDEYDITSTPNDFNVLTLFNFIESGAVRIPGFQRNFVWDQIRSFKLIESLILGIPVPQLFLYEQARNRFLVIDGQQRLMSIYYFIKKAIPQKGESGLIKENANLSKPISAFIEIGRERNRLVHQDYGSFSLEKLLMKYSPSIPQRWSSLKWFPRPCGNARQGSRQRVNKRVESDARYRRPHCIAPAFRSNAAPRSGWGR
jgi:hypothetical protein